MKFMSRSPKPPFFFCERWSIAIGIPSHHLEELPKTKKDKWTSAENAERTTPAAVAPHQAEPPQHKPIVNDVIDVFDWFSYYLVHWNFFTL